MYGLVNKAIKDLIVDNHGVEKWNEICVLSDFYDFEFMGFNTYPDQLTFELVKNASKVLNTDSSVLLEAFGEYWILYTANEGYGELLDITGSTLPDFLGNLDMLHNHISNVMPKLIAPHFSTRNETSNSVELIYRSERLGLIPMLHGLIKGLGKRFNLTVTVKQIEFANESKKENVFLITWP